MALLVKALVEVIVHPQTGRSFRLLAHLVHKIVVYNLYMFHIIGFGFHLCFLFLKSKDVNIR